MTGRYKILVAEDNPVNQRLAIAQLAKLGYRADAVGNGREAVEALERIPYDVVLMDSHMPDMDGFAATAEIRAREGAARHTTIIAMTADAMQGDRERCLAAGMDDYVSKPVKMDDLQRALERALAMVEAPSGAASAPGPAVPADGPIDLTVLAALRSEYQVDGEPDILARLIDLYLTSARENCAALREAVARRDASALEHAAHTLKGGSASMGAHTLTHLCERLQHLGQHGALGDAGVIVDDVERELARVIDALSAQQRASAAGPAAA